MPIGNETDKGRQVRAGPLKSVSRDSLSIRMGENAKAWTLYTTERRTLGSHKSIEARQLANCIPLCRFIGVVFRRADEKTMKTTSNKF